MSDDFNLNIPNTHPGDKNRSFTYLTYIGNLARGWKPNVFLIVLAKAALKLQEVYKDCLGLLITVDQRLCRWEPTSRWTQLLVELLMEGQDTRHILTTWSEEAIKVTLPLRQKCLICWSIWAAEEAFNFHWPIGPDLPRLFSYRRQRASNLFLTSRKRVLFASRSLVNA